MLIGKPEQTDWIKVNINNATINRRTARLLKYDFSFFFIRSFSLCNFRYFLTLVCNINSEEGRWNLCVGESFAK